MTRTSSPRKYQPIRRQTHLAVIELPDEVSAFQAYRLLHYHGISPEHLAIVGEGYSSPERIGLLRPRQIVKRQALKVSILGGTLGALAGTVLLVLGHLHVLQDTIALPHDIAQSVSVMPALMVQPLIHPYPLWALLPLLSLVGGILGAALGAVLGLFAEGTAAGLYRHRLQQGRYLLMIEGSEKLVRWGQEVLSQYSTSRLY